MYMIVFMGLAHSTFCQNSLKGLVHLDILQNISLVFYIILMIYLTQINQKLEIYQKYIRIESLKHMKIQETVILVTFLGVQQLVGHNLKGQSSLGRQNYINGWYSTSDSGGCICSHGNNILLFVTFTPNDRNSASLNGARSCKGPCCLGHMCTHTKPYLTLCYATCQGKT